MRMQLLLLAATLVVVAVVVVVIAIFAAAATTATTNSICADVFAVVDAAGGDPQLLRAICASIATFCHTAMLRSRRS